MNIKNQEDSLNVLWDKFCAKTVVVERIFFEVTDHYV